MAWLITGAQGCIGSWVVRRLLNRGDEVVVFDVDTQPRRLSQILTPEALARVRFIAGDIGDGAAVRQAMEQARAGHLIHLAALQVPACQADPVRGARVNVLGTLNLFESALALGVPRVVYASSCAVAGPAEDYVGERFDASSSPSPRTHYGVFKLANEGNARVYAETRGLASVGLRPWAVYGVGRDFGMTSDPTKAVKAAVLGRPFELQFGGRIDMQYAADVAEIFIRCAETPVTGAHVYNLRGDVLRVEEIVAAIERVVPEARGLLTHRRQQLPIVPDFDDAPLRQLLPGLPRTGFEDGVRETVRIFRRLLAENRLPSDELPPAS